MADVTQFTEQEIWNRIFNITEKKLCFTTSNTAMDYDTARTIQRILNECFDETNNRLKVM